MKKLINLVEKEKEFSGYFRFLSQGIPYQSSTITVLVSNMNHKVAVSGVLKKHSAESALRN